MDDKEPDGIIGRIGSPGAPPEEVQETMDLYAQVHRDIADWPVNLEGLARQAQRAMEAMEKHHGNMGLVRMHLNSTANVMDNIRNTLLGKCENIRRLAARLDGLLNEPDADE